MEGASVYKTVPQDDDDRKPPAAPRKPRADALRNRERVLEAARAVVREDGAAAGLETIARRAGVGIGTLYRHFPTRDALYEAIYRREVEQLVDLAGTLGASAPPVEALRQWMRANIAFIATKKGMAAALALVAHGSPDLKAYSLDRLSGALRDLLRRAAAANEVRTDVSAEDLLRTLVGMCYAQEGPGWQDSVLRMVDVLVDGLEHGKRKPHRRTRASVGGNNL